MNRKGVKRMHEAEDANDHTIHLVEKPAFSEVTMRRLVESNQESMHEMAGEKDQRHAKPIQAIIIGEPQRDLTHCQTGAEQRKGCSRDPMGVTMVILSRCHHRWHQIVFKSGR